MYGTIGNNTTPTGANQHDINRQNSADLIGAHQSEFAVNANNRNENYRAQIYSHCHVQGNENVEDKKVDKSARRRLIAASIVCLVFMIGEIVGGVLSNSLAIAADAAHLLTDFASFMISLFALWLSSRPASKKMSFGWYRAEVIGALISVLLIWVVTSLLVYMAIERLKTGDFQIDSFVMIITAGAGLIVNITMAVALNFSGCGHSHGFHSHGHSHGHHNHHHDNHHHHIQHDHEAGRERERLQDPLISNEIDNHSKKDDNLHSECDSQDNRGRGRENINVRAAYIHVIGDFLQSVGVLVAALVIHFKPEYTFVDPICTFIFSALVLITTINIIRDAINVLMEGIPDRINFLEVRDKLHSLPGVMRVHNLRIWSLSLDKIAISTHLVIDNSHTASQTLKMATDTLISTYKFFEVTIQVEEYRDDMKDCENCQDDVIVNIVNNK